MTRTVCGILLAMFLTAGARAAEAPRPVAVSIAPQAWLVERIGGDRVAITIAVSPGESPHSFDPTPRHVARLAEAELYFATGVPMENYLLPRLRSGCPDMRIVDTTAGIERLAAVDDHDGHDHAGDGDPHLWLSPRLVKQQAAHVVEALIVLDPDQADDFRRAYQAVLVEIDELDAQLAEVLVPVAGREFFVLHPAFGYFAAAYDLKQVSIEPAGGDPSPRHLAEVMERVQEAGARAIFTQPEVSLATARAVAQGCDVELLVLDPLAPDWDTNLRRMALTIREAIHAD